MRGLILYCCLNYEVMVASGTKCSEILRKPEIQARVPLDEFERALKTCATTGIKNHNKKQGSSSSSSGSEDTLLTSSESSGLDYSSSDTESDDDKPRKPRKPPEPKPPQPEKTAGTGAQSEAQGPASTQARA